MASGTAPLERPPLWTPTAAVSRLFEARILRTFLAAATWDEVAPRRRPTDRATPHPAHGQAARHKGGRDDVVSA